MQPEPFDIAIVMVVYNTLAPDCLPSVKRALEQASCKATLVVVDNASPGLNTHDAVKAVIPTAFVLQQQENIGFGRACNAGARAVPARYYFFLNPDTRLHIEGVLDGLRAFLEAYPRVGIAAPRVEYFNGTHQPTARAFPAWYMPLAQRTGLGRMKRGEAYKKQFLLEDVNLETTRLVDWVQGSAFMMDGALFHELGGFDDRYFMYFEDVDLCRSCWNRGRPVYYLPAFVIQHMYGKGSAKHGSLLQNMWRNRLARQHVASWVKYLLKWGLRAY